MLAMLGALSGEAIAESAIAPMPNSKEAFPAYCARLSRTLPAIQFKCEDITDYSDLSRPTMNRTLTLYAGDFGRAYAIATRLFEIPAGLTLPASGPATQTIVDPRKPANVWTSELIIKRAKPDQITSAAHSFRQEGTGSVTTVSRTGQGLVVHWRAWGD